MKLLNLLKKIKKDQFVHLKNKLSMIELIFGETNFPKYILKKVKKNISILLSILQKEKFLKKTKILTQYPLVNLEKLFQF